MVRIKFCDIEDDFIAIHFSDNKELDKLVDCLKAYGYDYGTGGTDIDEIKFLGCGYFGVYNKFLSLDRSKKYHPRNYCSCGLGYRDTLYDFKTIDWNIT